MSKFIKVQLEFNNEWLLLNAGEIIEIGMDNDGYTKITMKGGSYVVHQKMEQIEAQLLRDEFAKSALPSLLKMNNDYEWCSIEAYIHADVMLKERLK